MQLSENTFKYSPVCQVSLSALTGDSETLWHRGSNVANIFELLVSVYKSKTGEKPVVINAFSVFDNSDYIFEYYIIADSTRW